MARSKSSNGSQKTDKASPSKSRFESLFGFKHEDLCTWDSLLRLLCRPTDPAGLGVLRFIFGLLMLIDIWQERGMSMLVEQYGYTDQCRFPLFSFLKPLPLVWMYMVYFVLFIGELGIMLGLFYRLSCVLYIVCYWYIFLLDKRTWNNHSYLFGLMGVILLLVDANRYWSIDGLISKRKRHAHVPLWNYTLLRFQIFIVYFIAGLKKLDLDWVSGYSMHSIAGHFVFAPFRLFLTEEQVSLYIIHLGGLMIDLSMGYLLFFDKTRWIGFTLGGSFHLMNSQLFSIGMFPWAMLATMPLFCYPDWPRYWIHKFPVWCMSVLPVGLTLQTSDHCVYNKEDIKPDSQKNSKSSLDQGRSPPPTQPTKYHRVMCSLLLSYVSIQCIMPYSHGITKGYNHWTQGLYGYSWDMMVHSWNIQHIKVSYVDKNTGEEGYLNPKAWAESWRWSSHPDMVKQYADCVEERLAVYNITNIELYIDVWKSVNDRFQQRSFDPRVNMLEAPWSPFTQTPWLLPLLIDLSDWRIKLAEIQKSIVEGDSYTDVVFVADFPDLSDWRVKLAEIQKSIVEGDSYTDVVFVADFPDLSDWRVKLAEIQKSIVEGDSYTDVVFVADFPGLYLENFVQEDLGNTSVSVLEGAVIVELVDQMKNVSLAAGEKLQLPVGEFHNVHTVSEVPSCYMYIFVNTTEVVFKETINKYDAILNGTFDGTDEEAIHIKDEVESGPQNSLFRDYFRQRDLKQEVQEMSLPKQFLQFIMLKFYTLKRCITLTVGAIKSLVTGSSFEDYVNRTLSTDGVPVHVSQTDGNS